LLDAESLTADQWRSALDEAVAIQQYICEEVFITRNKDYQDPFRQTTFRSAAEMQAVVGTAEQNSFVKQLRRETEAFKQSVETAKSRR